MITANSARKFVEVSAAKFDNGIRNRKSFAAHLKSINKNIIRDAWKFSDFTKYSMVNCTNNMVDKVIEKLNEKGYNVNCNRLKSLSILVISW